MGVGGGLGAAGILLLLLSFIGLGVGLYYAYMCIQPGKHRKRSPHDPEHGPLITTDPDVNGNHEDSLAATAPLPYTPKSKIDEPDSCDEKAPLHSKEENELGVDKSESVFVPIEAEEAVTPTIEETTSAATNVAVPVVVIPLESAPEYKEPPKVDCLVTKSAEYAPTIQNGAAPRDCDLPVPIIMNAAFVVAKPITDSDEEDGLLLQKRLHHDDSLESEPVPPLVPIAHSNSAPKEEPSTGDTDEPIPSAPPKESTPDAPPESVLPTAPPKAVTPELPATTDENAQPSAPPEEANVESPTSSETKDTNIVDELQPENGVVYLETYKATDSEPIDSTRDDGIKEENSSTESSTDELVPSVDPIAVVEESKTEESTESDPVAVVEENKTEKTSESEPVAQVEEIKTKEAPESDPVTAIEEIKAQKASESDPDAVVEESKTEEATKSDPVTAVESETTEDQVPVTDPTSYGWTEGVVPTDSSSYGWSNDLKKSETDDNEIKKVETDVLPKDSSSESSDDSDDDNKSTASSNSEDSDYDKPVLTGNKKEATIGWIDMKDEIIVIQSAVEGESNVSLSLDEQNLESTEHVSSQIEPESSEESINISIASISSEEAVPPYTESAENVKSSAVSEDQLVPVPEVMSVTTALKDETSPIGEDAVDKIALPKDTEPTIVESETESVAHVISKVETISSDEATSESAVQMADTTKETSPNDTETEEPLSPVEDATKVALSSDQLAETELKPQAENIPQVSLSSEQEVESELPPQIEEPIALEVVSSLKSSLENIETEDTEHVSSAEEAQTALAQQHNTDNSDTESSEPDISEYSFESGPTADTTAKLLEDEISSSLEPEVTKFRTLSSSDDTAAATDPSVVSSVAAAVTITECDADSVSSISLSSDDEVDENSEGNKEVSDISLSSDEEETAKVELDKGISDEATAEETETQAEIAKHQTVKEQDDPHSDTDSDGAENPKEIKEEVVEVVQVVQEVKEKNEDKVVEGKEDVNHDVPHDSSSDESDADHSTTSSNADDSDADEEPCVKKSKIPRLKSKQSHV